MADNEIFNAEFYQKLNTLRMTMKMHLAAGMSGGRKSNAKGSSVEFSDFREYILGDDIRRIDWNAYGRFDKLFVKLFMEEKEGEFHLFIDGSKSMDFGEKSKAVCASRIAGALSYVVLQNLDRLYIHKLYGSSVTSDKGVTGRQAFARVIKSLEGIHYDSDTDLLGGISRSQLKRRGVSVVISDFYTTDLEPMLKYLAFHKQEIVLVQVLSREEIDPKFEGTVKLLDSETDGNVRITMSGGLIKEYRDSYEKFLKNIDALAKKYSTQYIRVASDESLDAIMFGALSKLGTG
ncbi:MAG: DUF58 domain-containing protein [Lachnospiraceae bacterium]|nr:DUF58 domain-containing protein [Lachnospiraceae bacterium]